MAQLPIVAGSEVQTPVSTVPLDTSALRQAALAPGELAAHIGRDVGDLFEDVSMKIQANRNFQTVTKTDLAMRKQKDDFTANLAKMPDEQTWLPAWKEQTTALRDQVMNGPNVGPDVKRHLTQQFDVWEAATTSEIRTAALLKGTKETREDAIADATYAAHQGDIEGAQNTLKAAVDHYAMSRADAHKISVRFPSIAAQAQADTAISTNPIKAPELIKRFEGTIEPRVYVGIMARANEAKNQAQSANLNDWAERLDTSPDGTIDPKALATAVKNKEITQRAADGLLQRMQRKGTDKAKDDFNVAIMQADDHDWTEDKKREETAREMRDDNSHLPTALRTRLNNHINAKMQAAVKEGERDEKPMESEIFGTMKADRAAGAFLPPGHSYAGDKPVTATVMNAAGVPVSTKEIRKMTDEEIKTNFGQFSNRETLLNSETLNYANATAAMRQFFKANPKATTQEANTYRNTLMRPHVEAQTRHALVSGASSIDEARTWARANPNDPRANKILEAIPEQQDTGEDDR